MIFNKSARMLVCFLLCLNGSVSQASRGLNLELIWQLINDHSPKHSGQQITAIRSEAFAIDYKSFSKSVRDKISAPRLERLKRESNPSELKSKEYHPQHCASFNDYASKLLQQIVTANGLERKINDSVLPLIFKVSCTTYPKWDLPDASMSSGEIRMIPGMIRTMESEAALAAVLSHELAHYLLKHDAQIVEAMSSWWDYFLPDSGGGDFFGGSGKSPDPSLVNRLEVEADALGILLLVRSGYPAEAANLALELSDVRRTQHEKDNERGISADRRQRIADRRMKMKERLQNKESNLEAKFKPYPLEIQDALLFYFNPKNWEL